MSTVYVTYDYSRLRALKREGRAWFGVATDAAGVGLHSGEMLRMAISVGEGRAGLRAWAVGLDTEFVLVREKALGGGELLRACREVRAATEGHVLVAGGRVDVALAAGLHGVHLGSGEGELRVGEVRRLWPRAWVSVGCHTLDEVRSARDGGADAVLFAPVFGKIVRGQPVVAGVGLAALAQACQVAGALPVFALGGVTAENAAQCLEAGASGVAAIRWFHAGTA